MKEKLFESINVVSYFLWEYTKCPNALGLWCCGEDIANIFQKNGITTNEALDEILALGRDNPKYIEFLRNISYRIYSYTGNIDHINNWFLAEKLLQNEEWKNAVITAANIYDKISGKDDIIRTIRSDKVRNFYMDN